jgi:hypothetical protein
MLLAIASDALGLLVRDSPIQILILNGKSVVETFQNLAGVKLKKRDMREWTLPRQSTRDVVGISYRGVINAISDIPLGRDILVLGYNHNLQSSFGVTKQVTQSIQKWISQVSKDII